MRGPVKITLAQAVRQGETIAVLRCVTPLPGGTKRPGSVGVCFHYREFPISDLLAHYPETTSLSDVRGRCSKCGGNQIDVVTRRTDGYNMGHR